MRTPTLPPPSLPTTSTHALSPREMQLLRDYHRRCLEPARPEDEVDATQELFPWRIEGKLLAHAREKAGAWLDSQGATWSTPNAFLEWFEALEENAPGQHDPLFDFLATRASIDAMRYFLFQELTGEAGFDDLVAMTQVRMPARVKLELAENYWDEMGRGHASSMHGPMLDQLAEELPGDFPELSESLALSALLVAMARRRAWAFHSVGALGAVELTAPGRCELVKRGLERVGISKTGVRYYALHAVIDRKHYANWRVNVLAPLVESDLSLARPIAEGAIMRLQAGEALYAAYRHRYEIEYRPVAVCARAS